MTMKLMQIGVKSLRGPNGEFLPSVPVYKELSPEKTKIASDYERKMIDEGAISIATAMKRYKDIFFKETTSHIKKEIEK